MMLQSLLLYNSVTYNGSLWVLDGVAVGASAAAGTGAQRRLNQHGLNKVSKANSNGVSSIFYSLMIMRMMQAEWIV